jgi:hypothetical protein
MQKQQNFQQSRDINTVALDNHRFHNKPRLFQLPAVLHRATAISELLTRVEEARTARQLTKAVNKLQNRLWKLPPNAQLLPRRRLLDALTSYVLYASDASLRLEAASWLRLLLQAGFVSKPDAVFATLVTAAIRAFQMETPAHIQEFANYLTMIFDSFSPFRIPSPALPRNLFPANEVFYPLAPLLGQVDAQHQESLLTIFAELPTLDDAEIGEHLLPVALRWSNHADAELRSQVITILARMSHPSAQDALYRLQFDHNPLVSARAKQAIVDIQRP